MHYDEIPLYNKGRAAFESEEVQSSIKAMLNAADLVIVTTKHLKEYYSKKYGVPEQNLLAVPNMIPKWWFGGKYDLQQSMATRSEHKAKPRVGIVSSLSHYNIQKIKKTPDGKPAKLDEADGKWKLSNGEAVDETQLQQICDDIDEIADVIESTADAV